MKMVQFPHEKSSLLPLRRDLRGRGERVPPLRGRIPLPLLLWKAGQESSPSMKKEPDILKSLSPWMRTALMQLATCKQPCTCTSIGSLLTGRRSAYGWQTSAREGGRTLKALERRRLAQSHGYDPVQKLCPWTITSLGRKVAQSISILAVAPSPSVFDEIGILFAVIGRDCKGPTDGPNGGWPVCAECGNEDRYVYSCDRKFKRYNCAARSLLKKNQRK